MPINTILFDTDGVVVIRPCRWSVVYEKKFGLPPEKMLPFFNGPFADCVIGKSDLKTAIQPYLKE